MDAYTESRLHRFNDELENMTDTMETMEYYGSAEGVVFATVNGKHELLRVEITPSELPRKRRATAASDCGSHSGCPRRCHHHRGTIQLGIHQ